MDKKRPSSALLLWRSQNQNAYGPDSLETMTGFHPELKFVAIDKPGRATKPGDDYELRSHVRRMVALDKASRPHIPSFKFVSVSPTAASRRNKKRQRGSTKVPPEDHPATAGADILSDNCSNGLTVDGNGFLRKPAPKLCARSFGIGRLCAVSLREHHPFATVAAEHVDLPLRRLDALFKHEAFRHAAEPLFDTTHVDSSMSMSSVFPLCLTSSTFLNALVYSIVQAFNQGKTTLEQLKLKSRTISALHETIVSGDSRLTGPSIGAIMILRGVAYKWEDYATHDLHAQGLAKALQTSESCLTPAARRALFWQDLFASMLISAPRKLTHDSLPEQIYWKRCQKVYDAAFPRGFLRHRAVLPDDLLGCIQDLIELQTAAADCKVVGPERHAMLEPLQAHIESRLAFQTKSCEAFGAIAAATRLAIFIITYTSYMSTWDFSLIPGRLAEQLVKLLEMSLSSDLNFEDRQYCCMWSSRHDLLLWLLLVGATAAVDDRGVVADLQERYTQALGAYQSKVSAGCWSNIDRASQIQTPEQLSTTLRSTLEDFVLTSGWAERRLRVPGWFELEVLMDSAFLFAGPGRGSSFMDPYSRVIGRNGPSNLPLR